MFAIFTKSIVNITLFIWLNNLKRRYGDNSWTRVNFLFWRTFQYHFWLLILHTGSSTQFTVLLQWFAFVYVCKKKSKWQTTHDSRYAAKYECQEEMSTLRKSQVLKTSVLLFGNCRLPLPIIMNFYEVCFFYKDDAFDLIRLYKQKTERYAIKLQHVDRLAFTPSFDAQTCLSQKVITAPSSWVR